MIAVVAALPAGVISERPDDADRWVFEERLTQRFQPARTDSRIVVEHHDVRRGRVLEALIDRAYEAEVP